MPNVTRDTLERAMHAPEFQLHWAKNEPALPGFAKLVEEGIANAEKALAEIHDILYVKIESAEEKEIAAYLGKDGFAFLDDGNMPFAVVDRAPDQAPWLYRWSNDNFVSVRSLSRVALPWYRKRALPPEQAVLYIRKLTNKGLKPTA